MTRTRTRTALLCLAVAGALTFAGTLRTFAQGGNAAGQIRQGVPNANSHNPLISFPNIVAPGFSLSFLATGTDPLENPCDGTTKDRHVRLPRHRDRRDENGTG